jgi:hypothetical protein
MLEDLHVCWSAMQAKPGDFPRASELARHAERVRLLLEEIRQTRLSDRQIALGDRVRFVGDDWPDPSSVGIFTGQVVDIAKTSSGDFRYRIRTDRPAPQSGNIEKLVYGRQGSIVPLDRMSVSASVEMFVTALLSQRIADGEIAGEDIASRMARYGLMDPQAFLAEMRERAEQTANEEVELCGPWMPGEDGRIEIAPGVRQENDEFIPAIAISIHRGKPIHETGKACPSLAAARQAANDMASDWFARVAAEAEAESALERTAEMLEIGVAVP